MLKFFQVMNGGICMVIKIKMIVIDMDGIFLNDVYGYDY